MPADGPPKLQPLRGIQKALSGAREIPVEERDDGVYAQMDIGPVRLEAVGAGVSRSGCGGPQPNNAQGVADRACVQDAPLIKARSSPRGSVFVLPPFLRPPEILEPYEGAMPYLRRLR